MNNIELLFEDKFFCANISKNSKYLFLSKSKVSELYDFRNRTKLCDLHSKDVISSVFSEDERFLALQKSSSIDLYDLADNKKIKTFLIGECFASCIMFGDLLIYPKKDKKRNSSVVSYNFITQENEILFNFPFANISSIKNDKKNLVIVFHKTSSDTFTVVKINMATKSNKKNTFELPGHGLNSVEYSSSIKKLFVIQKNMEQNNLYELFSIDVDINKKEKIKTFNLHNNAIQLKSCNNKLYVSSFFNVYIIDLLKNFETKIPVFPAAIIGICDNSDFFYTYNGEYLSLYKHRQTVE